ncbi:Hsp20/alpha crystallin family protein [Desulfuromonas sp.]|uniref:Hsp20/alpha crystallin family protein n=1 Tax=Desulfuromonas sp. TaxID=892 RepID=UPI0025C0537B|nr:Hsp20/alpha crystallin family protein [Desulfuromonas sp.]
MGNRELAVKTGAELAEKKSEETWTTPSVDIYETGEALTVVADLPGVSRERLELGIDGELLTIEGRMSGREAGFRRRFRLPDHLDLEQVAAELSQGVLTVTLPKAAAARPRRIEVSVH